MVTIAQIAKATGHSTYTVSCALRGVGRVASRTRKRILEQAARMGYYPNSAASLLARRRHRRISEPLQMPVAIVGDLDRDVQAGFLSACAALGLEGRAVPLAAGADVPKRINELWQTGVKGLYLREIFDFEAAFQMTDLTRFAVIKEGRGLPALRFHLVRHDPFDYMLETVERVFAAGYRRVAVVASASASEKDDLARFGAIAAFQQRRMPEGGDLRLFPARDRREERDGRMVRQVLDHRPDAIIGFPFTWFYDFREVGVAMPGEIGFATVLAHRGLENTPQISGCDAAEDEMARRGVAWIYKLLQSGERGFAEHPTEDVIEPVWIEGETLGRGAARRHQCA